MRYPSRVLAAASLALAVPFLAACGGGANLLPADQASTLHSELSSASSDISSGACISAGREINQVQTEIASLPGTVDPTLVSDLSRGAETVRKLAPGQCTTVGPGTDTTKTSSNPTTTPRTTTSPTTTTAPPTTTTTTTTTSAPTTTTVAPPTTTTSTPPTTTTTAPPGTGTPGGDGGATLPGTGTTTGSGAGENGQ